MTDVTRSPGALGPVASLPAAGRRLRAVTAAGGRVAATCDRLRAASLAPAMLSWRPLLAACRNPWYRLAAANIDLGALAETAARAEHVDDPDGGVRTAGVRPRPPGRRGAPTVAREAPAGRPGRDRAVSAVQPVASGGGSGRVALAGAAVADRERETTAGPVREGTGARPRLISASQGTAPSADSPAAARREQAARAAAAGSASDGGRSDGDLRTAAAPDSRRLPDRGSSPSAPPVADPGGAVDGLAGLARRWGIDADPATDTGTAVPAPVSAGAAGRPAWPSSAGPDHDPDHGPAVPGHGPLAARYQTGPLTALAAAVDLGAARWPGGSPGSDDMPWSVDADDIEAAVDELLRREADRHGLGRGTP